MSESGSVSGGIAALKDLHLQTVLVENGRAGAAIVAPAGEGYASSVGLLLDRVSALTGVALWADDGISSSAPRSGPPCRGSGVT